MQFTTFWKIVLAVAYAAVVVLAGSVHWWMAFGLIWLGAAGVLVAIHFRWRANEAASGDANRNFVHSASSSNSAVQNLEEFERENVDLSLDPFFKREAGNVWHSLEEDRDLR